MNKVEEVYEKYYKFLFRIVYFITQNVEDTSDIIQEAFLKAYERFDSDKPKEEILKWLITAAKNNAFSFIKRRKKIELIDDYINIFSSTDLSLSIILLYNLDTLKNTVPTELFDYLIMNIIDDVPLLKLSKKTGISYEKFRCWRGILFNELKSWIKDAEK